MSGLGSSWGGWEAHWGSVAVRRLETKLMILIMSQEFLTCRVTLMLVPYRLQTLFGTPVWVIEHRVSSS